MSWHWNGNALQSWWHCTRERLKVVMSKSKFREKTKGGSSESVINFLGLPTWSDPPPTSPGLSLFSRLPLYKLPSDKLKRSKNARGSFLPTTWARTFSRAFRPCCVPTSEPVYFPPSFLVSFIFTLTQITSFIWDLLKLPQYKSLL